MKRLEDKSLFYTALFGHDENLTGLLLIKNPGAYPAMVEGADRLVIAVYGETMGGKPEAANWLWGNTRIQVRRMTTGTLDVWIANGDQPGIIQWLAQGEVLYDREGYLQQLRERLEAWSFELKERKLLTEYSKFLRAYLQAKQDLKDGHVMDGYTNILSSIDKWAQIALIEEGLHPELTVWGQMRRVNPGIYKLYEELTSSGETLEQRVHLVLLAVEFSVLTKMKSSCALLLRIIRSRQEPWRLDELQQHPDLVGLTADLSLLLHKLAQRGYLRELAKPIREQGISLQEIRYRTETS